VRAFKNIASCLGTLIAFALAACDAESCDGNIELVSVCYNDADEEVPCCGPAGNKYACPPDAGDDADADAGDDADAGEDDGGPEAGSSSSCPEHAQCMPPGGGGFDYYPSYVWMGKETDSPPPPLPGTPYENWVDVVFAEPDCPTCSCAAPVTGCVLPNSWNVNSTVCQDISSPHVTPFDPPVAWDGSCSSSSQIPAGILCDGVPCVRSLVVQPPTAAPCVAEPAVPPEGQPLPPPIRTKVIGYVSASLGTCDLARVCIAPPPPGYRLCRVAYGSAASVACPNDWSDRHTGWTEVEEQRACSACSCGSPQGSSCEVLVKVYSDAACGNERGSLVLTSSDGEKCVDLITGTALGSKTAELLSSHSGICQPSGGEVIGEAIIGVPVTYCCVPELAPPP